MVKSNRGFSLVELMIVVAIIGILAAIAVPNFKKFQMKAKQSEAKSALSAVFTAEKAFQAEWSTYFADFRDIGFKPEGNLKYRVGFSGVGAVVLPASYPRGTLGGVNGSAGRNSLAVGGFISTVMCNSMANRGCLQDIEATSAVALAGATVSSPDDFIAQASGNIVRGNGANTSDVWQITQDKVMTNTRVEPL